MLINLPNDMIADAIARKLMSLFVIKDKQSGTKIMLCEMTADLSVNKINTKYYPITGNEEWLSIFTDEREGAIRVPRETIAELKSGKPSNTTLMDLGKKISVIDAFTSVTLASSKSFEAPDFSAMMHETQEANIKTEDKNTEPVDNKEKEGN